MNLRYHVDHNFIKAPLPFGDRLSLIQIGTLHCNDLLMPNHLHRNWFELTILTQGDADIYANGSSTEVSEGNIFLSFPAEVHAIRSKGTKRLHYDYFSFYTDHPVYLAELEQIMRQCAPPQKRVFRDNLIRTLVRDAIGILNEKDSPHRQELLEAAFLQILLRILRNFRDKVSSVQPYNATQAQQFCFSLMQYIDTHIYTMKQPGELAAVTNYSYSYLTHLFRSVTGQTLSSYFQKKRMETAAALLAQENLPVGTVASMLHYTSVYAFSKAFRAYYGQSPRAYRNQKKD